MARMLSCELNFYHFSFEKNTCLLHKVTLEREELMLNQSVIWYRKLKIKNITIYIIIK